MGRLWSTGGELNSITGAVEVSSASGVSSIDATIFRSGAYAFRENITSAGFAAFRYDYLSADTQGDYYYRFYLRITTLPGSTTGIFGLRSNTAGGEVVNVRLTAAGALQLYNEEDAAQVGSDSAALSTNTWYRIELRANTTTKASTAVDARIDGVSFASGTINLTNIANGIRWGNLTASTTLDIYFDDIAINDSAGSFQNSWPGEEEIIHIIPNAAGDSMGWTDSLGADDYTMISEVTPDDGTTMIGESATDTFDVNLSATPAALASDDTINVVQVGVRFSVSSAAGTQPTVVLRIKASGGGTTEESSAITFSSTSWFTNAVASPRNYQLTLYDLPGASTTAWTKTDLDAAQIGARTTNDPTGTAQISTMWLLVGHKPAAAGAPSGNRGARMLMGIGL